MKKLLCLLTSPLPDNAEDKPVAVEQRSPVRNNEVLAYDVLAGL